MLSLFEVRSIQAAKSKSSSCPRKNASRELWLICQALLVSKFGKRELVLDLSQHALRSRSGDVSLVWWPGKQQHTVRGSGYLEVIDTGIHTDNGQQVAIDYNINFISNRHDL